MKTKKIIRLETLQNFYYLAWQTTLQMLDDANDQEAEIISKEAEKLAAKYAKFSHELNLS